MINFTPGDYLSDRGHPIAPAYRCFIYLVEEFNIRATLIKAVGTVKGVPALLEFMRRNLPESQIKDRDTFDTQMDFLIKETPVATAAEMENSGYAMLHAHSLCSMWSSVEANMEDTFVNLLMREAPNIPAVTRAFPRLRAARAPLTEHDTRKFVRKWEGANPTIGIAARWTNMLMFCRVDVAPEPHQDELVDEINEVRNCILHRHGVVDQRAVTKAPSLAPLVGQALSIDSARYMSYFDALTGFMVRLTKALDASPYATMPPIATTTTGAPSP